MPMDLGVSGHHMENGVGDVKRHIGRSILGLLVSLAAAARTDIVGVFFPVLVT